MNNQLDITLEHVLGANDLQSLNGLLTQAMKQQQHQSLIRGEQLSRVVDAVVDLANIAPAEEELFAAAVLGRLAAVARGRETEVLSRAEDIFSQEPSPIEILADGDEKEYAAKTLAYVNDGWLRGYCAREALTIDTANNARKELLRILLNRSESFSDVLARLVDACSVVRDIEQLETRIKRVRRIVESLHDVVRVYEGDVGAAPGIALANLLEAFL